MTPPRATVLAAAACTMMCGCMSLRLYDGAKRDRTEVAVIAGDYRISAGAPLTLVLRAVDGVPLDPRYHAAEVLPGEHLLLVDCSLKETGSTSRHEVKANVARGRRYGLAAELAPGLRGCESVRLESRD
jgi:hypothetical protein